MQACFNILQISCVNFARSDVSTRSFDFEIEMKGGSLLIFNSVEKFVIY